MKILLISLHQPWASLCFTEFKNWETRGRPLPPKLCGVDVAIHAAKKPVNVPRESVLRHICATAFGGGFEHTLPRGGVIGFGKFGESHPADAIRPENDADYHTGDWTPGRFVWELRDMQLLPMPIPMLGHQGFWYADIDLPKAA